MGIRQAAAPINASEWLLLAMIFALPFMNPPLAGEVIVADVIFVLLLLALVVEVALGGRRFTWLAGYGALLAYITGLAPSLLATGNIGVSLFKFGTEFYLIGLAAVTALIVDSEAMFRRAVLAWLAGSAAVALVAVTGLFAFSTGYFPSLLHYMSYDFGTLPPGPYPRLAITFVFADMAGNYLTVSLALLLLAHRFGYVSRAAFAALLAGIVIASLSTISPGLGGIALIAGLWLFVTRRRQAPMFANMALLLSVATAGLFIIALIVTPFFHPTAPFEIRLPGGIVVYPSGRFLVWSAALEQFIRHPFTGIGLGIDPVHVRYLNPSGFLEQLSDAHNIFLSIAAQCGIAGLLGLGVVIWAAIRRTPWPVGPDPAELSHFLLGATFLDVFVYQGLGGSFEDTRHIWVLLGLLIAASRPELSHPDGNNHRPAEPSPG